MNNASPENFWDVDIFSPRPNQDTELLKNLGNFPGLKEFLRLRQVHALEHATVWVLSEQENSPLQDNETLGGLSTDQGFYLYGQVNPLKLERAVCLALSRLQAGEGNLAIHPRCGTNLSVGMLVTIGLVLASSLLLPRSPITQLLGLGIATATAAQLTPDLGVLAQKYLTTSIPFNLAVVEVALVSDIWGKPAHFVRVKWQDLQ